VLQRGSVVAFAAFVAASTWLACSSSSSGEAASQPAESTIWDKPCTLDLESEPVLPDGLQRCTEVWAAEKNARKPCIPKADCESAGGLCIVKNGGLHWDTRCFAACNPSACPEGTGSCVVCEGQEAHCEKSPKRCYPPTVAPVNGAGQPCTQSKRPCSDKRDCCGTRFGNPGTCYQLMTNGQPNSLSQPSCQTNCETNRDCDDIYGDTTGFCCLPVLSVLPPGGNMLTYTAVGRASGDKTCVTKKFDNRCTRVPTSTSSSSSGGSSGSGGCDYSGCMEACTHAGGTNCGEDCKC
jgi:hypothetical protein